jgi:hypothetical protein
MPQKAQQSEGAGLCGNSFEQESVKLVIFESGAEEFPVTFVVEPTCVVGPANSGQS